jgi:SAM-dependent methyltransferase
MIQFNKSPRQIIKNIPRFVMQGTDYTTNFGFQWNKFKKTQIDSHNNDKTESKVRFFAQTNWDKEDLSGKNILEAGSGAGRFSEVVLKYTAANLYSFDYSNAVEANFDNNHHFGQKLRIFQASIYEIPFDNYQFDKVFCFGVLQHTPDFRKSINCLCNMVKIGGELVVDFYPIKGWHTKICAKYLLRPYVKNMPNENLLKLIENNIDWMIRLSKFLVKNKLGFLTRFIPIVDIYNTLPVDQLNEDELREYCILDTFDMFSPMFDNPQKISKVKEWIEEFGLNVTFADFVKIENGSSAVIKAKRIK